jgi:hypothetical protein
MFRACGERFSHHIRDGQAIRDGHHRYSGPDGVFVRR